MADQPGKKGFSLKKVFAVAALGLAGVAAPFLVSHGAHSAKDAAGHASAAKTAVADEKPGKPASQKPLSGRDMIPNDPQAQPAPGFSIGPDMQPPGIVPPASGENDPEQLWRNILGRDNTPYKPFMTDGGGEPLPPGHGAVSLQLESAYPEIQGLLLSPIYPARNVLDRHGQAATGILQSTAARYAQRDMPILFVDRRQSLESWFLNKDNPEAQSILGHAAVLSLSMAFAATGNPANQAIGTLTTAADIEQACSLWQNSHTLLVWSAGNNGRDAAVDLERPAAYHTMCADTLVRVGEAENDHGSGDNYIEPWSSRPASFVVREPFQDGYKYRYYRDGDDARRYINELFAATPERETKTNAQIFDAKFSGGWCATTTNASACDNQLTFVQKQLRTCHPSFKNADFPGKDILQEDKRLMRQHPEAVREAFTSCLVAAAEAEKHDDGADGHGFVGGKRGTSFAGPYFAGLAAAAHEMYPQLTEYDLTAAALMAAKPVVKVKRKDGKFDEISYHDNGRGLRHNAYAGGFGLLEADDYLRTVRQMAALLAENPALATQEQWIRSADVSFSAPNVQTKKHNDYRIPVTDDAGVLQTILKLRFAGGYDGVPARITLINPAGVAEDISPTKVYGEMVFSLANTLGNFGNHSRGIWTVRVPANVRIEQAQLIIPGFRPGGVIDKMLERVTGHAARITELPAPVRSGP